MALIKYAALVNFVVDGPGLAKQAHRATFEYEPRPGFLYIRSRAISSRTNDNFDAFPAIEIEKGYRTFIGKPVFVNHVNEDHRRARGVVIDAALHHDVNPNGTPDTWCEVLMEVDAVRFPKLARAIVLGHVDRTSMGVDVEFSICSACGNRATTPAEYCRHIPQMKGSKIIRRNAKTGRPEETLIYEECYGLSFFENSLLVEDPADPTAYFLGVDKRGLEMSPRLAISDVKDSGASNAIHGSDLTGRHTGSLSQHSHLANFVISELGMVVPHAPGMTIPSDSVTDVVGLSADQPMSRILAGREVAGMSDLQPLRDWADQLDVAPAVGKHGAVGQSEGSVALPSATGHPGPAGLRAARAVDLGQVPLQGIQRHSDHFKWSSMEGKDYEGRTGDERHITRVEHGTLPIDAVRNMPGVRGEVPGEHRNRLGQRWEDFKSDIAANGVQEPIFITVDHGSEPKISEGNHRRDAAVELGHSHIPAEVRYFGHAEQQGTVEERHRRTKQGSLFGSSHELHTAKYEPEPGEPEEGRMGMGPDPTGFFPNGIALKWHQDHHALVRDALHQWKGDPGNALVHLDHEINDDPQPDSGSGKKMRAWAGALHWELHNNAKQFNRPLYRGQNVSESKVPKVGDVIDHDMRPRGYSSNQATARRFAGRPERDWSGQGRTVPVMFETAPGTHGLRIKNYLGGQGLDWSEQEHILTGQHRVTSVTPTERGLHVKTEPVPAEGHTAGLRAFIAGTWDAVTHTEGTHSIPIEQAKQWIDPAMKDRDKLIKFDGQGYWDNLLHSMKTEGQREPIEVKSIGRGHVVWEGNHRVHAADMLGWSHIDANFTNAQRDPFPEHRKQAAKEEPYLTLYHGTNMAAAKKIQAEGFHPQNPRHTANEIEDRYGLPRDSVWNHKYNEFSRGFRGESDPKTYFSGDRRVSEQHARIGSEVINDAMGAAWHVQHEHDAFDSEGMWNPGKAEEKKRWVQSETAKHYQPAVITAHVPWSAYEPEANARTTRHFGYDEFMDLMEGGKHLTTASLPGHLPKEWVHKVEPIEAHTAGLKAFVAVNATDEVPPEMGESPIPEGHVRLYHQTGLRHVEDIRQHGLTMEHASRNNGPVGVWASHGTRFYAGHDGATVEFHVPYKELQETGMGQSPYRHQPQEDWEQSSHHTLVIPRSIHPDEISAIHLPWHDRYRYFKNEGMTDQVKAGEFDNLKDMPDYGQAIRKIKSEASLHLAIPQGEDEIPPRLGTAPIPEGHVRLYHHTWSKNVPSIREHGLMAEMGQGDSGKGYGNEPSAGVWAATQHDEPAPDSDRHVIEFHAHPREIDVNGPDPGASPEKVHQWQQGDHNVLMRGSVPRENILAIHAPWHTAYHQITEDARDREDVKNGKLDWAHNDSSLLGTNLSRAIKRIQAEGKLGPGQGHYFEPTEEGSPWCAVCHHHKSVTAHPEPIEAQGLLGFVAAYGDLMTREEFENHPDTMWHGTPDVDKWETGAAYGIHIGTKDAAREALHARIGKRADGKDWDGTQEWGKTLLDRDQTHSTFHPHGDRPGGTWTHETIHNEPTYPSGQASYSGGERIPLTARPSVFPVRIAGPMTNTRQVPHEDFKANGYMRAQIGRGRAKRGYFYTNVSEDEGSVSAVVPNRQHLQTYDDYVAAHQQRHTAQQQQLFDPGSGGHEHLPNPRGGHDWFHGTPHHFESFEEERPEEDDPYGGYDFETGEKFKQPHWNTHLGQHWTSLQGVAEHFAKGQYGQVGEGKGHVITANLGIKHPKDYKLESDMDKEAFEHAWDGHDPKDYHDEFCHNPEHRDKGDEEYFDDEPYHYNDEHERGDEVDRKVQAQYRDRQEQGEWLSQHPDSESIAHDFKERLKGEGHDGITYGNELEGPHGHQCAITFEDHQIHNLRRRSLAKLAADSSEEVSVAGLAVLAADTGRVLMLQRSNEDDKDPARGTWEFPGGHLEPDEAPIEGAIREWKEELGCGLPAGHVQGHWTSKKIYQGFVYVVPHEDEVDINHDHENRQVLNPDDPDGDGIEVAAWFEPKDLPDMPALRAEVKSGTDWSKLKLQKTAARQTMVPLQHILDHVQPTDMLAHGHTWPDAFRDIEENHVDFAPAHWSKFLDHVQAHGIQTPVVILHRGEGEPSELFSGHHRIWAAHKLGLSHVPAQETDDPSEAYDLLDHQAATEGDWRKQAAARPYIGKGWWLTPEGKKIGVYDHYETTPGMARQMIRPHMAESGQVRVRSFNNQLNIQTSRPFTDKQRQSLLMDADKHSRVFVDVLHPDTEESIHSESGGPEDADRMLSRAHRAAIPHTAAKKRVRNTEKPQKCEWCQQPATKSLLWAEGMAYIPTCDAHEAKTRSHITDHEGDEVVATHTVKQASYHDTGQWSVPPSTLPNGDSVSGYGDAVPGGYNESLRAFHPETGEETGRLDVHTARGDPVHLVAWMHTPEEHRGRGTMTHLLEHYRQHHLPPGERLDFGMTTPEGQAWIDKHQPKTSGLQAFAADLAGYEVHGPAEGQNPSLRALAVTHQGDLVGGITWHKPGEDDSRRIDAVWVHPDHRRRGLASYMKSEAEQREGYRLRHSTIRTPAGEAWAQSVGGAGANDLKRLVVGSDPEEGSYAPSFLDHLRNRVVKTATDEEWRGGHQPSDGPPIHDLTEPANERHDWTAPDDIYEHMHYYGDGEDAWDRESQGVIKQVHKDRGAPGTPLHRQLTDQYGQDYADRKHARRQAGDHLVTIYRAAPRGLKHIGTGDWVSPSQSYARQHGVHATDPKKDWPVYKAKVPAKHVRWAGDSLNEFGYFGPPVETRVHYRGGSQAERLAAFVGAAEPLNTKNWFGHEVESGMMTPTRFKGVKAELNSQGVPDTHPMFGVVLPHWHVAVSRKDGKVTGALAYNPNDRRYRGTTHVHQLRALHQGDQAGRALMTHVADESLARKNNDGMHISGAVPGAYEFYRHLHGVTPEYQDKEFMPSSWSWDRDAMQKLVNHPQAKTAGLTAFVAALDPDEVTEASPEEFHRRFSGAMEGSPFVHHVTNHSPEEIRSEHMRPLTTNGGDTGVLIHDHGDGRIEATGLYNQSKVKGAGVDLLRHAIDHHGVNYVEAYGPRLPQLYRRAGFQTTEKYRFDRSQADPGWDFRRFDSPSYHIMHLRNAKKSAKVIPWLLTASVPSPNLLMSQSFTKGLEAFSMLTGTTLTPSPGSRPRSRPSTPLRV